MEEVLMPWLHTATPAQAEQFLTLLAIVMPPVTVFEVGAILAGMSTEEEDTRAPPTTSPTIEQAVTDLKEILLRLLTNLEPELGEKTKGWFNESWQTATPTVVELLVKLDRLRHLDPGLLEDADIREDADARERTLESIRHHVS